jgi:hypothetical protein
LPADSAVDEEERIVDTEAVFTVGFILSIGYLAPLRGTVFVNNG